LTNNHKKTDKIPLVIKFFGTGFFSGFFPFAPGTFGSMVAVLIYLIPGFDISFVIGSAILLFFCIGLFSAEIIEKAIGHDPSIVVIDEFVGMWISLIFIPKIWYLVVIAFFLFRFFDITKIFPANIFDRRKGGFAIMFDDVIAGVYANIVLQILIYFKIFG
jgi:phosphatidylglycerophosphatase A